MKFIAIHKTKKHMPSKHPVISKLPDNFPIQCEENFETPQAALEKYPEAIVMSHEAYAGYKLAFQHMYDEALAKHLKPTFWKKLNPFKKRNR